MAAAAERGPRTDNGRFMDAMFWMGRKGARRRDLPERLAIVTRSSGTTMDWVERGVLQDHFDSLSHDGDFEWLCVNATIIRAHQHARRMQAKGPDAEGLGPFQGRLRRQAPCRDRPEPIDELTARVTSTPEYGKLRSCRERSSCRDAIRGPSHAPDRRKPAQRRARAAADRSRRC